MQGDAKSLVILAAPGTGKTTWALEHGWTDMDIWAGLRGLHTEEWHQRERSDAENEAHYRAIDQALKESRGLKLIGALFWEFKPDAIVIIDEGTHRRYVDQRDDLTWADANHVVQVLEEMDAPKFPSFDLANEYLSSQLRF